MSDLTDFVLDDFDAADTARMEILPPRAERAVGWIEFAGPGHEKSRKIIEESRAKQRNEERQKKLNPKWQPRELSQDELVQENAKFLADRVTNWQIFGRDSEGAVVPVPFTHERAMQLFADRNKGWLYGDAFTFVMSIANFIKASAQT